MPTKLPLLYYREFGLRKLNHLLSPKIINITDLPRKSIFHYCTYEPEFCNIDPTLQLFNLGAVPRVVTEYVELLKSEVGNPRKVAFQLIPAIRAFHKKHRKFKRIKDGAINNGNEKILTVVNYNYLQRGYKYVKTPWTDHYTWTNLTATVFRNINELCSKSTFDHYMYFDIPSDIPSRSMLMAATRNFSTGMLKIFDTRGEKLIFELWKWFDPEKKAESMLSNIEDKNLSKVNFIFRSPSGKTALLNMGYLYSWIEGNENMTPLKSLSTKKWTEVRKAMLVFMMYMGLMLDPETDEEIIAENTADDDNTSTVIVEEDKDLSDFDEDEEETESNNTLLINKASIGNNNLKNVETINLDKEDDIDYEDDSSKKFDDLDSILDEMEKVAKIRMKKRGVNIDEDPEAETKESKELIDAVAVEAEIFTPQNNREALNKKIETDVEFGLLTAADMRKFQKDIAAYETMKDPYGTGQTIQQAKVITEEELRIDEAKSVISTGKLVRDESMKKSSLISFDEDYNSKIIRKDILNAVDALQRGGIVIRDYEVKEENTILGSYEVHSVELKPIDGAVSTVHFRIPKVNKDGTFTSNGNKYVARKQRAD